MTYWKKEEKKKIFYLSLRLLLVPLASFVGSNDMPRKAELSSMRILNANRGKEPAVQDWGYMSTPTFIKLVRLAAPEGVDGGGRGPVERGVGPLGQRASARPDHPLAGDPEALHFFCSPLGGDR